MKKNHPKKSLGQNFLIDQNIIDIIINTGDIKKNDTILEVGPGRGALTAGLLESADKVVAIEKHFKLSNKI